MLSEFFNGKILNTSINPEEAVAQGAAIYAAILNHNVSELNEIILFDVIS
jgi:heat shock protein 1/8